MVNVLFIGGFARSGKTTLYRGLNQRLQHNGVYFSSTSEVAWDISCRRLSAETGVSIEQARKKIQEDKAGFGREYLIESMEDIVVPAMGRASIAFASLYPFFSGSSSLAIVESFNDVENKLQQSLLKQYGYSWKCINLRSYSEEKGVDGRTLLPGPDIWQEPTPDATMQAVIRFLRSDCEWLI